MADDAWVDIPTPLDQGAQDDSRDPGDEDWKTRRSTERRPDRTVWQVGHHGGATIGELTDKLLGASFAFRG